MRLFALLAAAVIIIPTAGRAAQILDLTGATPTLSVDALHPIKIASGEQSWWPAPQKAQPLNSPQFSLSLGMPPYGAWGSSAGNGAYWSGWSGEAEAYPNLNEAVLLAANGIWPIATTQGTVDLVATPISANIKSTLPPQLADRSIVSGAFNSYPFGQQYGYFEITARVPTGDGLWPAFWMVPVAMTPKAEIDVMEILGKASGTTYSTIHTNDQTWARLNKVPGVAFNAGQALSNGYHRYGVDWGPQTMTFYVDGSAIASFPTPLDMHQPFFFIVNLAIGTTNTWAGPADATTALPARYSISAIRAWQRPAYGP